MTRDLRKIRRGTKVKIKITGRRGIIIAMPKTRQYGMGYVVMWKDGSTTYYSPNSADKVLEIIKK